MLLFQHVSTQCGGLKAFVLALILHIFRDSIKR